MIHILFVTEMIETVTQILAEGSKLDMVRITVAVVLLLYASYADIKTRRISDKVWIAMYAIAIFLNVFQVYYNGGSYKVAGVAVGVSVIIIGGLSYLLYRLYIFHGADYKALFGISLILPVVPNLGPLPLNNPSWITDAVLLLRADSISAFLAELNQYFAVELFGFTVFVNTAVFSSLFFLSNIIYNVRNDDFDIRHPLRSTCARKISKGEIPDTYAKIIESTEEDNPIKRGFNFIVNGLTGLSTGFYAEYLEWHRNQKLKDPDTDIHSLEEIELENFIEDKEDWFSDDVREDKKTAESVLERNSVWVTPSIPFIVPITAGLITSVIFGNIAYLILFAL